MAYLVLNASSVIAAPDRTTLKNEAQVRLGCRKGGNWISVKGYHLPENCHEELQDYSGQNDERDGCSMNFLVYFAWFINEEYVVSIHVMLGNEI